MGDGSTIHVQCTLYNIESLIEIDTNQLKKLGFKKIEDTREKVTVLSKLIKKKNGSSELSIEEKKAEEVYPYNSEQQYDVIALKLLHFISLLPRNENELSSKDVIDSKITQLISDDNKIFEIVKDDKYEAKIFEPLKGRFFFKILYNFYDGNAFYCVDLNNKLITKRKVSTTSFRISRNREFGNNIIPLQENNTHQETLFENIEDIVNELDEFKEKIDVAKKEHLDRQKVIEHGKYEIAYITLFNAYIEITKKLKINYKVTDIPEKIEKIKKSGLEESLTKIIETIAEKLRNYIQITDEYKVTILESIKNKINQIDLDYYNLKENGSKEEFKEANYLTHSALSELYKKINSDKKKN